MGRPARSATLWRGLRDLALGLALFIGLVAALGAPPMGPDTAGFALTDPLIAQAVALGSPPGIEAQNAALSAMVRSPALVRASLQPPMLAILGVSFAVMFAFNLAILRHLRRVYASPRRRGWRRGR